MAALSDANKTADVAIPVTGNCAWAPLKTKLPTATEGKAKELTLDEAFKGLGLISKENAFEWAMEKDGDAIEFHQDGYSIPSGMAKAEVTFSLSQTDKNVMRFLRGKDYDSDSHMVVDAAGSAESFVFYVEEIFKNSVIRRRLCANASIKEVKESKAERGKVTEYQVTVSLHTDPSHAGGHFHEWLIETN